MTSLLTTNYSRKKTALV